MTRVVIAEDETLLLEGLQLIVARAGFEVVAAVADADALIDATRANEVDLVITDIRMPPTKTDDGLRALRRVLADRPGTAAVVLSQHVAREYALELMGLADAGVGYLLKHRIADVDEFIAALERVVAGETVMDHDLVQSVMSSGRAVRRLEVLTERQHEVLALMAEGRSNVAIAELLHITEKAVVRHVSNLYDALDLAVAADSHRRVQAVIEFLGAPAG
ncbi:DNA-binding response regulator [Homoserinibacter sp. GY 40078]|uniref:response regulator transcription factor n=1 Tax=Homoserinibacter sp. GY 40078 TaxID=2603275 RepID=UPI0011CC5D4E|nr:response regulator transcription factor [Homoserinibacter sp. GY 40078]TXK18553.1 response regulator transcription factor [Homoserinibacter sp. GY 40078]